jgi:hypothetical protein
LFKFTWDLDPIFFTFLLPGGSRLTVSYYGVLFWLMFVGGYALFDWQVKHHRKAWPVNNEDQGH